jgi:hypothetical protein
MAVGSRSDEWDQRERIASTGLIEVVDLGSSDPIWLRVFYDVFGSVSTRDGTGSTLG